jgi:hypothetical protein
MRYGARTGEYGDDSFGDVVDAVASIPGWSDVQEFFNTQWATWKALPATLTQYMHRAAAAQAAAAAQGDSETAADAENLLTLLSTLYTGAGAVSDQIKSLLSYIPGVPASWTQ